MDGRIAVVHASGLVTYRASALGRCSKALVASRLGYEEASPPEKMKIVFQRGHDTEEIAKEMLRADGWKIWDEQLEVDLNVSGQIVVRGHIDGKGVFLDPRRSFNGTQRIIEIKSTTVENPALTESYDWQLSSYMHGLGLPAVIVWVQLNEKGEVLDYFFKWVDEPPISMAAIRTKILLAESLARLGTLPAQCDSDLRYPCPFYRLHEDMDTELVDDGELEAAAVDYESARVQEKVAGERKNAARKVLDQALAGRNGKLSFASGVRVSSWNQRNPPRLRTELLRRWLKYVGGPAWERLQEQTSSKRVKVSLPKTDDTEVTDE